MVDFGAVIGDSVNWTKKMLFRPFNLKKWLILAFVAIMAGAMSNGCNLNTSGGNDNRHESSQSCSSSAESLSAAGAAGTCTAPSACSRLSTPEMAVVWTVLGIAILFVLLIVILFTWLGARFSFVFIEDIVKDDASVKKPFADNAEIGNSYFKFALLFMLTFFACVVAMIALGIFIFAKSGLMAALSSPEPSGSAVGGFLLVFIPFLVVFVIVAAGVGIFSTMVVDLALPIMYKDRIRVLAGIGKAWDIVKANKGNFLVYLLIKLGLGIGAGIAYLVVFIIGLLIALVPMILLSVVLYFISMALPAGAVLAYWVIVGIILTPVAFFLLYCLLALNVPFAVFFRTMSMKFLERLDPNYALIPSEREVAPQQ